MHYLSKLLIVTLLVSTALQPGQAAIPKESFTLELLLADQRLLQQYSLDKDLSFLNSLYVNANYKPLWIGRGNEVIPGALSVLAKADQHGLPKKVYHVSEIGSLYQNYYDLSPTQLGVLDLLLTQAVMNYIHDMVLGYIDPTQLKIRWHIKNDEVDLQDLTQTIIASSQPHIELEALAPQHFVYIRLQEALARFQSKSQHDTGQVPDLPDGKALKVGMSDERVALLRQRLGVMANDPSEINHFDAKLEQAVKDFQSSVEIKVDGIVGDRTRYYLNRGYDDQIGQIMAALEQWRWLPRQLGDHYVIVNIPSFQLFVFDNNQPQLKMNVVTGMRSRPTPLLQATIESLVFNPPWYVPPRIAALDIYSKLGYDPDYLARHGYRQTAHGSLVQRPGSQNGLGRIKFDMPNIHAIYLHDTPKKKLFDKDLRAFSSGCVRVQNPKELATYLLSEQEGWTLEKIEQTINTGRTSRLSLDKTMPVYIIYTTAWVDIDGQICFGEDIYRREAKVLSHIGIDTTLQASSSQGDTVNQ